MSLSIEYRRGLSLVRPCPMHLVFLDSCCASSDATRQQSWQMMPNIPPLIFRCCASYRSLIFYEDLINYHDVRRRTYRVTVTDQSLCAYVFRERDKFG